MTAHAPKPTITPERVAWFAAYLRANPSWGEFHVSLDDGNWCKAASSERPTDRESWPADVREAAAWFDTLTQSQRRRLGQKAETRR